MEENKITLFLKRHFWSALMLLASVVVFSITLDRFFNSKKMGKNQDYLTIQKITERESKSEPLSKQALETMEAILARRPELHPDYDALLSLSLLQQENADGALKQGMMCLKRGEKNLAPYFVEYAKNSLLITQGNLAEAFVSTGNLNEKLEVEPSFECLRAFNLLRLALLAKKLNHKQIEQDSFAKLQTLPSYPKIAQLFVNGSYNLKDFFS